MAKGICAIIPSNILNPAFNEPIPPYAYAWNPTIQRPTHLPEDYDERIAAEYIFFIPAGPEETADGLTQSGVYVVAKKCDHCDRLRKACTRARPTCQMCQAGRHDCKTSDPGYVHLSGPKGTRPSRAKGGVPGQPAQHSHGKRKTTARAQTEGVPDTRSSHPRLRTLRLRSATASRESLPPPDSRSPSPTFSEGLPKRAKTAPHGSGNESSRNGSPNPKPREARVSKKRKAKPVDSQPASAGPSRPKKSKVESSASRGRRASSTRKRKQTTGRVSSVTDKEDNARPSWVIVKPTMPSADLALLEPHVPPRIWASSKEELLNVVPALKNEVNGVVWGNVEAPVLFLQGGIWPGDGWDGSEDVSNTVPPLNSSHELTQRQLSALKIMSHWSTVPHSPWCLSLVQNYQIIRNPMLFTPRHNWKDYHHRPTHPL
ncbi:hypothetical protein DAEQUDRAFT_738157 [Daedalea quercina L-15889]|uniref:Zn(2)-C6 fungal-type domain-containing protein n=1 Tax=Daedalea quercina L-15889 TaxID=1314783 RepID=A0A165QBD7_9APHY|nr:hypothetical protein DAEQUDRAFT_738157 [Daedalea quercina L-15889]